jgi:hypothetical protein
MNFRKFGRIAGLAWASGVDASGSEGNEERIRKGKPRSLKFEQGWPLTLLEEETTVKISNSAIAGAALIAGFVLGSMLHTPRVHARNHMTAHIEQVSQFPTGRETNGSIAGFSCASSGGEEPKCFALVVSPD